MGGWGGRRALIGQEFKMADEILANFKPVCDWTITQDGRWKITGPV